jgi:hypothetical protein
MSTGAALGQPFELAEPLDPASHVFRNAEFIPLWLGDLAIWRNKLRVPIQHHPSHPEQCELRTSNFYRALPGLGDLIDQTKGCDAATATVRDLLVTETMAPKLSCPIDAQGLAIEFGFHA